MQLDEIYQEVILDHFKNPRCKGDLPRATATYSMYNPLCGDEIKLHVLLNDSMIQEVRFEGHGCAISQAAASMLSELCMGKSLEDIENILDEFRRMMKGEKELKACSELIIPGDEAAASENEKLGDMVALAGVKRFPARIKCAMLAYEAMHKCLDKVRSGLPIVD
jgi:nitrogen fixation protein NifU and related proteins